jgi:hypothetical protein
VLAEGQVNALEQLGIRGTPLDEGLRRLVDVVPEQLPSQGVGPLLRKVYAAEAHGCTRTALALQRKAQRNIGVLLPLEVGQEKGAPARLEVGTTFSVSLPVRGILSMRVVEVQAGRFTAATTGGHPLAGTVSFTFRQAAPRRVRLAVEVTARAADVLDGLALGTVGFLLQDAAWRTVLDRLVEWSGGAAPAGIAESRETLEGERAAAAESRAARLAADRVRRTRAAQAGSPGAARLTPVATRAPGRRGPRRPGGTGSARRSPAGTGSARTTGRTARPAAARKVSRRSR